MLHEILLALSGRASPLASDASRKTLDLSQSQFASSVPESRLLEDLARLSNLHAQVQTSVASIISSHESSICRRTASYISSRTLRQFQERVLAIEKSILQRDSGYVGHEATVPLSSVVSELKPWQRLLEWIQGLIRFMGDPSGTEDGTLSRKPCSGAALLDRLRSDIQTGYSDIRNVATGLSSAAEHAWVRVLSEWILQGRLPRSSGIDFFIQRSSEKGDDKAQLELKSELAPSFLSESTQSSILFVGQSIGLVRSGRYRISGAHGDFQSLLSTLIPCHARMLEHIHYPLEEDNLFHSISLIRQSISESLLKKILPVSTIVETLKVLRAFFLVESGEFVNLLVTEVDFRQRHSLQDPSSGDVRIIGLKSGEIASIMASVWSNLASVRADDIEADDLLDLARVNVQLVKSNSQEDAQIHPTEKGSGRLFQHTLFGGYFTLQYIPDPPIDLFLTSQDVAYIKLLDKWRHSQLRRVHPSPLGPPQSNRKGSQEILRHQRERARRRALQMRPIWASASAAIFLLGELSGYLQVDVISQSWGHFHAWLDSAIGQFPKDEQSLEQPESPSAKTESDSGISMDDSGESDARPRYRDPETISQAHRAYLSSLSHCLLLDDRPFNEVLQKLLQYIEHFTGCIDRLEAAWQSLDLETDEGVVDDAADTEREERRARSNLISAQEEIQSCIEATVVQLERLDIERAGSSFNINLADSDDAFRPFRPAGLDSLLMKLDFGSYIRQRPTTPKDND